MHVAKISKAFISKALNKTTSMNENFTRKNFRVNKAQLHL
jgi:hypothetical protein